MYVFKNKESDLYLVLVASEIYCGIIDWYVSETDEVSCASKFKFIGNLESKQDLIEDFNLDDWEAILL